MGIAVYKNLVQGSQEWLDARRGILCASEMKNIITVSRILADIEHALNPKKKVEKKEKPKGEKEKEQSHLYELLAQRITGHVEPHYLSDDMLRGKEEEIYARQHYEWNFEPVEEVGFITNDKWGFKLGYSPDGLVGDDGLIECKSRRQKYQIETILDNEVPEEYVIQIQTGLLVSERKWCDFISYHGGLPMYPKRMYANTVIQQAILDAATAFYQTMEVKLARYNEMLADPQYRLIPTERTLSSFEEEMQI